MDGRKSDIENNIANTYIANTFELWGYVEDILDLFFLIKLENEELEASRKIFGNAFMVS